MDDFSMGQSTARVGVLVFGTPALIVLVLVLIFLLVRNPKLFRLRMIGLHYEGFDPAPRKESLDRDQDKVPAPEVTPRSAKKGVGK